MADKISDSLLQEATEWLLKLDAAPDDSNVHALFEDWLARDPLHAEAWRQVQKAWQTIGALPSHTDHWPPRAAARRENSRQQAASGSIIQLIRLRPKWAAGLALAASLLVLAGPLLWLELQADVTTTVGETRRIVLEDGSRLTLAPKSAITLQYSAEQRRVQLLEGEAFFDVMSDRKRPFVVNAVAADIVVVGTAFDVRVSDEQIAVDVAKGMVDVRGTDERIPLKARLSPGEGLTLQRRSGVTEYRTQATENIALWREGRLFVDGATLGDVVHRLSMYRRGWMIVSDPELAARRVTGLFDLRDPDAALQALVAPHQASVHNVTPLLSIITAP